jgi:hypothetical protein
MTEEEFLAFCAATGHEPNDALDELVHDVKSQQASDINNQGAQGQLAFLKTEGYDQKEIIEYLGTGGLTPSDIKKLFRG